MSKAYVREIEKNDDWDCFVCDKNILRPHRAQHWALRNFMCKQLENIHKIHANSEEELNDLLSEDVSTCCPRKRKQSLTKSSTALLKRPLSIGTSISSQPPAKKSNTGIKSLLLSEQIRLSSLIQKAAVIKTPQPVQRPAKKNNNEIVCTPDIMGMINGNDETANKQATTQMPSTTIAPPPLVMRQENENRPRAIAPKNPIYHTVNGYQIDLNHAARQEIFRLPNGKLIQVRKQTAQPNSILATPPILPTLPRPQFTIRQAQPMASTTTRMFRPQQQPVQLRVRGPTIQPQQRFTFADGRVIFGTQAQIPSAPVPPAPALPVAQQSTVFTQQNGSISVARAPHSNTPFGKAKVEFEDKIINGMEICQHTINKMITLTNSTSFKTSRTFSDLKDLYIHLQYLFSYTSGKMKVLQEELTEGMEILAKQDPVLKEKTDADELEIVETKTDVIEVDSEDDEIEDSRQPTLAKTVVTAVKKPILKHIQYTAQNELPNVDVETALATHFVEKQSTPERTEVAIDVVESSDKKLNIRPVVKVEKLENSKSIVVKHYLQQIRKRKAQSSSRETTPETDSIREVTLDTESLLQSELDNDERPNENIDIGPVGILDLNEEKDDMSQSEDHAGKNLPKEIADNGSTGDENNDSLISDGITTNSNQDEGKYKDVKTQNEVHDKNEDSTESDKHNMSEEVTEVPSNDENNDPPLSNDKSASDDKGEEKDHISDASKEMLENAKSPDSLKDDEVLNVENELPADILAISHEYSDAISIAADSVEESQFEITDNNELWNEAAKADSEPKSEETEKAIKDSNKKPLSIEGGIESIKGIEPEILSETEIDDELSAISVNDDSSVLSLSVANDSTINSTINDLENCTKNNDGNLELHASESTENYEKNSEPI